MLTTSEPLSYRKRWTYAAPTRCNLPTDLGVPLWLGNRFLLTHKLALVTSLGLGVGFMDNIQNDLWPTCSHGAGIFTYIIG